jgi:beta-galactosidase
MKEVLYATLRYGNKMPLKYKLKYLKLMLFHGVNYEMGYKLYGKYIGNWGSKEVTYTVEGYRNGKLFKTVNLSRTKELSIATRVSKEVLEEKETYDVALVRIRASDQNDSVLPYYNEPFTVEASGAIEVIGPKTLSFYGGYSGVYVKTIGKKGKGTLKISTPIGSKEIVFEVK